MREAGDAFHKTAVPFLLQDNQKKYKIYEDPI